MCLAVPAQILEIQGSEATLDFGGVKRKANISLLEDVKIGDYVIVHVGFAIQKLDEKEAKESLRYWKEILEAESYAQF
ncbi:MAG: HypC/HybG/HupF family hydrogenase formation chaperone [Candidatus Hydrothermarchaeota archaeon]|nr:HypC/HybG/HupF family hydrogenase formation chaperone [Candidatus Hydrothermarchaeota archaeon]